MVKEKIKKRKEWKRTWWRRKIKKAGNDEERSKRRKEISRKIDWGKNDESRITKER